MDTVSADGGTTRGDPPARVAIVMPAYNAAGTIASVLRRIPESLREGLLSIVVVNDGSTDDTATRVRELQGEFPELILLDKLRNEGYARAQKSGFREALARGADIVAVLHSDGQYAPEELPRLLAPLEHGEADLVLASRMARKWDALRGGMPLYKWVANRVLSAIENRAFGLHFSEYHSGYMLYARRALETIPFAQLSDTFHIDGEMLFIGALAGLRVKELAIPTHYGTIGSHLRPIPYGFTVLRLIWYYKRGGVPRVLKAVSSLRSGS